MHNAEYTICKEILTGFDIFANVVTQVLINDTNGYFVCTCVYATANSMSVLMLFNLLLLTNVKVGKHRLHLI